MSLHIQRLQLRLPAGYGPRAHAIARGVAEGLAHWRPTRARSLARLELDAVRVGAGATDQQVTQAVLQQLLAALEVQS